MDWKMLFGPTGSVALAGLMAVVFMGAVATRGEAPEAATPFEGHPADGNMDWRLVMGEAIAYLADWQQGDNPIGHAIRAAYLWQNGEVYAYDPAQDPPLCWILPPPVEGEGEGEPVVVPGELVDVPAGTFQMGDPWNEGDGDERPVHAVTLDAYRIGKYEVTNQEYADVLNWAHGRGYLQNSSGGAYTGGMIYAYNKFIADTETSWDYSQLTYSGGVFGVRSRAGYGGALYSIANHPMVCVSWFGAVCYCNWLNEKNGLQPCYDTATWTRYEPVRNGYRLPTEAEWERAAAWDGSRHWRYGMTSDTIDITRVNYYDYEYGEEYANPLGLTSYPYTAPVGWYNGVNPARVSAPGTLTVNAASPVGAYDMSGNVWEWCHDWYDGAYYVGGAMTNPLGPSSGSCRVLRGGSWVHSGTYTRSADRGGVDPVLGNNNDGFRVAASVFSSEEGEGEGEEGEVPMEGEGEGEDEEGEVSVEGEGEGEGEIAPGTERVMGDITFCWIPPGSFMMGRYPGEQDSNEYEEPQHEVTFAQGFWMSKYEITQGQWQALMGSNPASRYGEGANYPVYNVSWNDIRGTDGFLNILNAAHPGLGFRLPSEAEWEYACRAGTMTRFYWGDDPDHTVINDYAWHYYNNTPYGAKEVGLKLPNIWGLHDMSGNVWEWCEEDWHDSYTGAPSDGIAWVDSPRATYRVLRGGSWYLNYRYLRSALRVWFNPDDWLDSVGFRVAVSAVSR